MCTPAQCVHIINGTVCPQVEALIPGFNLKDATLKLSMNTNSAYIGLTHPMNPVDGGGGSSW